MKQQQQPIHLDKEACYAALKAHDSRFDGHFFVGVSSTGIYCRPICRVKLPKAENCTFFPSAAAAEAAGFRPCRRCRPEMAPGLSPAENVSSIAHAAAAIIDENCLEDLKVAIIAERLKISARHLRRAYSSQVGVSPVQYLQTRRLLLAKQLLSDTALPITEIALLAGFCSIRRFNDSFKKIYKSTPSYFRNSGRKISHNGDTVTLKLSYRPPYAWDELLNFLADRAIPGVELVKDGAYFRAVTIRNGDITYSGWIRVVNKPKENSLSVTLSCSLLPVLPKLLSRIKCLFDLNCDPAEIYGRLGVMNALAPDLCIPGIRLPGCLDPFEMSVRAVLGQQVSIKAARTLAMRFAAAFGGKVDTPFEELYATFPTSDVICDLKAPIENQFGPLGITGARARAISALAQALASGTVHLTSEADPEAEMAALLRLPGFGQWTVQYIGMRAFGWPDAFPGTDYGVKKALNGLTPNEILDISQAWRPWRSYATLNLWNSLNNITNDKELIRQ
jgi:AraC family transcriptional regulator of adaptative response / DNA-3-methyladenine glycosylase II